MTTIRPAAVAGRFYPADPDELRSCVQRFIDEGAAPVTDVPPKAIVVPHAGYPYSGPIAGSGYAQLTALQGQVSRVVLLGPAHYVTVNGLAASSASFFETPLGRVAVDTDAVQRVLQLPQVQLADDAHEPEHSLEVHLPFLQVALGDVQLVPLLVGRTTPPEVAEVMDQLWGGEETVFVISSDLSHYHDYDSAAKIDRQTAESIHELQADRLRGERACGFLPIGGFLTLAKQRGLHPHVLDLRSSGDTAGPKDRVVGYGAFSFA